jgi:septal ring factor EnvC (AmiA/AmiB activator)
MTTITLTKKQVENIVVGSRELLFELLQLCTPDQINKFELMYPSGPAADQLLWAISQVKNTIKKQNIDTTQLQNQIKDLKQLVDDNTISIQQYKRDIERLENVAMDYNAKIYNMQTIIDSNAGFALSQETVDRLAKLDALEIGGVDNWEWYDEAMKHIGEY